MDIQEVTITVSYNPSATNVEGIVDALLDAHGVEGTFVPSGQDNSPTTILDSLASRIFGD